ncbi:cell division cycle and apoptosis regulator protein 1-like isoform X2 [Physella acuta]|uniref:cell division cycle and apoptosis regulator protein 1-like isoform X2 n=1 Tax=Physella acuta TaxID=109671 RepID=UPI0027DB89FA|nr:cell division cycle and apoptosis regulator protein 1-like isoform X2 [Physella acuta]
MSNQYGGNKNPPWARQDYSNQGAAGMMQANVTYPYNQTQTQFTQQQLTTAANLQAAQGALLPQPSLALTSALAGSNPQVGAVSYPIKPQGNSGAVPNQKQRIFTGSVTKMHENFGFVDEEVFFQVSCVKGMIPKVGDKVLVEASYNANMPFKWNATRVISLPDAMGSNQMLALQQQHQQQQQQQQQQLKAIQQQAIGLMGTSGMFNSGGRSGINTGPGLLGDPLPRNMMSNKDQRGMGMGGGGNEPLKERERRDRERRERREARLKRSRSPVNKRSRSPPKRSRSPPSRARSPRSPPKRRVVRPPPRYVVQVPKILLDVQDACVVSLKNKYSNLYIPSDFFHASFSWVENFPLTRPFTLGQSCNFHVMHKDVPCIRTETVILEPSDADHLFSAKVMLLASPSEDELYKKSCCLAEDLPDAMENFQHPTRLLQFLVGTRGKNEPMAIGGPWSPSLDGPNPHTNPLVLIKTAIRTTKALTGIDLSSCTQWYRFAEIRYFRPESKHKDRVQPARVETVVIFLPDVWTCNPTRLEWNSLQAAYQKQLQLKLNPEAAQQQEEEESEEQTAEDKAEPSHFSTLDPKVMKVGDLRRELELRNISPKGLKSQLIARLTKILKAEQDKEQEDKEMEAEKAAQEEEAAKVEEENESDEEEKSESKKKEEEEQQRKEKREKAVLERRYKLPETPSVLVHPSPTAKGGKFDCSVMSLSLLLDYRPEDNKEHSFEVSLFAELFNEMLMRDFGFQIYKSIVCAPTRKEEDKKKEEKKEKDEKKEEKDKRDEKDGRDSKKNNKDKHDEPSPKRKRSDDRDDREDKRDRDDATDENSYNGDKDDENKDDEDRRDKEDKDKKKKKDEEKQKKTVEPQLLLAFSYFDQNHCGYLTDKDTEDIIHTLGLKLSRAQIKKLLQRILQKDAFHYRRLTDCEVDENNVPVKRDDEESIQTNPEQLAKGNKESLRKLLELSGVKTDSLNHGGASSAATDGENPNFVYYKGALLDIESLMQRLDRSEKSRTALEKNMQELTDELKTVKTNLTEEETTSSKLQHDLRKVRSELEKEKSLYSAAETLNKDWLRTANETKSQVMSALNSLNTMLIKDETKSKAEDHKTRSDEHKRKKDKDEENKADRKEKDTQSIKEEI